VARLTEQQYTRNDRAVIRTVLGNMKDEGNNPDMKKSYINRQNHPPAAKL
jgi:hypothetical protein